ncbi:MAG: PhoH family protein [Acidimicrobiia bacterium]|nr:MAG: PhoH family protein [Acidimicrobiia bacterium]
MEPARTTTAEPQTIVHVAGNHLMADLLGPRDELLDVVEDAFPRAVITVRGNEISVHGDENDRVGRVFQELVLVLEQGQRIGPDVVRRTIDMVRADERPSEVFTHELLRTHRGGRVRPRTSGQKRYVDAIAGNIVTFGIGPAGTGKSWLAVAMGVQALQNKDVERIVLTRPAVEAGERLGFLPGDLMAKVDPYLRPLYDALHDMVGTDTAQKLLERGAVEVAPLAFMRGRTLNNSFIILDEAQNTTPEQMKMFLTRLGFGSKAVITGDVTQVDVPGGRSGLGDLQRILDGIDDLAFVHLTGSDVVRHRIVADIVDAYAQRGG